MRTRQIQRIAVLTSGGDSPGMNAAVRAVVRSADARGVATVGVENGFGGLTRGHLRPLDARDVSGILHLGGTFLGTARSHSFRSREGRQEAIDVLVEHEIDGVVVIGGDGSLTGAHHLAVESDIAVVGLPGTIDNDLGGCDSTLGFDTAVNTALESIDRIRDTAASHGRLFFIEVMGRSSGWIALFCGLAGGATDIVVPEREASIEEVRSNIAAAFKLGKRYCTVVIAEGHHAGSAYEIADQVATSLDEIDYRVTTLGHVQRGGSPSMADRILAARLGDAAVTALLDGETDVMVGIVNAAVRRSRLEQVVANKQPSPHELLRLMDRLAR